MEAAEKNRRGGIAAIALGVFMVACCLAAPLIAAAAASLAAGALFGLGAAAIVLLGACLYVGHRLRSGGRC